MVEWVNGKPDGAAMQARRETCVPNGLKKIAIHYLRMKEDTSADKVNAGIDV